MSADRYEIEDCGERGVICYSPDGNFSAIFGDSYWRVVGAIRQQARDIDQLRAELAAVVAERDRLITELPLSTGRDVNETRERLGLITRIADGPSERAYVCATTAREVVGYVIAERDSAKLRAERAEARLAAIDAAPTVAAVVENSHIGDVWRDVHYNENDLPPAGTELIARPAKEST